MWSVFLCKTGEGGFCTIEHQVGRDGGEVRAIPSGELREHLSESRIRVVCSFGLSFAYLRRGERADMDDVCDGAGATLKGEFVPGKRQGSLKR
jgi:hypothetical protein